MKVLVAGGAGYIGSHVAWALLEAGYTVTILDNLSTGHVDNVPRQAHFIEADILDRERLFELCRGQNFAAVIHLAALKAAGDSMQRPGHYAHHNLTGSYNLIDAVTQASIPAFVFSSSAAVYGEPHTDTIDESHPLAPTNFYGFTKLQIEQSLAWFQQLKGLRVACLRYFNAAGYDAQGRVPTVEYQPHNLVPIIMEAAIGKRELLTIHGNDYPTADGTCVRDYVHVTDLAIAHVRALTHLTQSPSPLVLNLGTARGYSVLEVLEAARRVTGQAIPHRMGARRPGDPPRLVASFEAAHHCLDWQPHHSQLDNILATAWSRYRSRP